MMHKDRHAGTLHNQILVLLPGELQGSFWRLCGQSHKGDEGTKEKINPILQLGFLPNLAVKI